MEILLGSVIVIGIGVVIVLQLKPKGSAVAESKEIGELQAKLEKALSEKDELSGKGKQLFVDVTNVKSDLKALQHERDTLQRRLNEFEAKEERKEKEFTERLEKLEGAKEKLEEERQRVIREDEERRELELQERDRMWANHENHVIATLTDLCKQPQFGFTAYTNTNLPEGFDGSLKPDFLVEFLDQYIIFDAKISKAKSLQTYVNDQVKKTVEKVKNNDQIYKHIFLVVPTSAIAELKNHQYTVDDYTLYVISPEALPPILASLKRITTYEFAESMDPMQRENIVQIIADLDFHINLRNAADIILSKMGTDLLERTQKVDASLTEEVALKKQPMNMKASIAAGDIKRIVSNLTIQNIETQQLVSPKVAVRKKDLEAGQQILGEILS